MVTKYTVWVVAVITKTALQFCLLALNPKESSPLALPFVRLKANRPEITSVTTEPSLETPTALRSVIISNRKMFHLEKDLGEFCSCRQQLSGFPLFSNKAVNYPR
jgi:hypothetical protein